MCWLWLLLTCLIARADDGRPNLVLITLDTTRADALSCDEGEVPDLLAPREGVTPNLCALAADGVRFQRFYAHAPTTLNSHASLFTGLDPHGHAVPRNGFPLDPAHDTLAERLQAAGYDTLAVVGARALERDMGLDAGFRLYDDEMSVKFGPMHQDRADGVLARTLALVERRSRRRPLFLWVHFYDPHGPYRAPEPWLDRYTDPAYDGGYSGEEGDIVRLRRALRAGTATPADLDQVAARYLGEVAYADHHVGLLLSALGERGLLDHALIVATADHGEALGENPASAWAHGRTVDEGVMRVPLIAKGIGLPIARGAVIGTAADLSGLAPTLEALLGLPPTLGDGVGFPELLRDGPLRDEDGWPERPTRVTFLEATRATRRDGPGWNNLDLDRGVRVGGLALIHPRRAADRLMGIAGAEAAPEDHPAVRLLNSLLQTWDRAAPPLRVDTMDADTLDALRALGYIGGPEGSPGDGD